jgi:hypothetical protein
VSKRSPASGLQSVMGSFGHPTSAYRRRRGGPCRRVSRRSRIVRNARLDKSIRTGAGPHGIVSRARACVHERRTLALMFCAPANTVVAGGGPGRAGDHSPRPVPKLEHVTVARTLFASFQRFRLAAYRRPRWRPSVSRRCSVDSKNGADCGEFSDLSPTRPASPSLNERDSVVIKNGLFAGI